MWTMVRGLRLNGMVSRTYKRNDTQSLDASGSGSTYTSSLTISPLADQDDGTYTCTVVVTGGSNVQEDYC